jgi:L-ascorbate metabolism protein UlaG (beta-lactamase superfamily)
MARVRRAVLVILALIIGALAAATIASTSGLKSFGGKPEGERLARIQRSPHFSGGRFVNPVASSLMRSGSSFEMLRHQLFGKEVRTPPRPVPVVSHGKADFAAPPASGLRATWLGHATTLVEIDGRRVLLDPIWSERCSPSTLVGPRRFHPPPIALADVPPIDAVLISHDHYDHLDITTVQALAARGAHFVVPLGIGAHLEAWEIPSRQVTELDWEESAQVGGLTLTATPARHYSGRGLRGGSRTLWASWVIAGPAHRAWFSGDSGYFDAFREIGRRHGPFDLTLIKIGASDPTWSDIHMTPEEAVQAHQDVGGKLMLPVHWGTFNLAFHDWNEPPERALAAARKAGVALVVPRPGEPVDPSRPPALDPWWR